MRRVLLLTMTLAVMGALAVPAGATPPTPVYIEVTSFSGEVSPFVNSGPAVDSGLICGSGVVVNTRL